MVRLAAQQPGRLFLPVQPAAQRRGALNAGLHRRAGIRESPGANDSMVVLPITNRREDVMQGASKRNSLGRRSFLGTSACTLLAMSNPVFAQAPQAKGKASQANAVRVSQAIADFVIGIRQILNYLFV